MPPRDGIIKESGKQEEQRWKFLDIIIRKRCQRKNSTFLPVN